MCDFSFINSDSHCVLFFITFIFFLFLQITYVIFQNLRNNIFKTFFRQVACVSLAHNGEQLNRECSLFSECGKYVSPVIQVNRNFLGVALPCQLHPQTLLMSTPTNNNHADFGTSCIQSCCRINAPGCGRV